jgi:hypothetical protein
MDKAQPAETVGGDAHAFQIRQFNTAVVAHHYVFNVTFAVDQRSNLTSRFVREFRQLAGKLRGDNLVRRNAPCVQLLNAAQLIGLQAGRVP